MSDTSGHICVFCASSPDVEERYMALARAMGDLCADQGWRLVYGGGRRGLMGTLADAALAGGAPVTGVIPEFLKDKEVAHTGLDEIHITQTMHERQMKMMALAGAFVILPGGLGTMAEFFEVLTWKQLGLHDKPIVVVNAHGYWDSLIAMMDHAAQEKFLHNKGHAMFDIAEDISGVSGIFGKA